MRANASNTDPLELHRAVLQPMLQAGCFDLVVRFLQHGDESTLLSFLHQQGLAPLWAQTLEKANTTSFSSEFFSSLHQARLQATGIYLIQTNQMENVRSILDSKKVEHVVYKGADIRERYYPEPALRPAVDIDVLIDQKDKERAIVALHDAGFSFHGKPENISHEASLVKGKTSVDLHWDILRPGRTRTPMSQALLESRQKFGSHWGLSDEANLFVMLVHPVFVRYSTTPLASLVRTVDLYRLMTEKSPAWAKTIELLDMAGLKTAAWITLRWLQLLTGHGPEKELWRELAPGKLRQNYLNWWLEKDIATRLMEKPAMVQFGFTLPAHDKVTGAMRAVLIKSRAEKSANEDLKKIESSLT
jgi:Uncharacterised nucleotidyltransferase